MTFPDDLPSLIEYRTGDQVLRTFPHRPVEAISSSGDTNAKWIRPQIPIGATGWRLAHETEWRPMKAIPASWLPFLNRPKGSAMDFRKEGRE